MKNILRHAGLTAYGALAPTGVMQQPWARRLFLTAYAAYKTWIESGPVDRLKDLVAPGTTVVDVGANVGFFTLKFARWVGEQGQVIAIEPDAEDLTERLIEANEGKGVDVVFDMSGGAVFDASYRALAHFGRIVVCGIATQEPNQVSTGSLLRHSRSVVGFYLFHCLRHPGMFAEPLQDLFERAARGELKAIVGHTYPLSQAAQAQIDMRERRTTGKLLLDPSA